MKEFGPPKMVDFFLVSSLLLGLGRTGMTVAPMLGSKAPAEKTDHLRVFFRGPPQNGWFSHLVPFEPTKGVPSKGRAAHSDGSRTGLGEVQPPQRREEALLALLERLGFGVGTPFSLVSKGKPKGPPKPFGGSPKNIAQIHTRIFFGHVSKLRPPTQKGCWLARKARVLQAVGYTFPPLSGTRSCCFF